MPLKIEEEQVGQPIHQVHGNFQEIPHKYSICITLEKMPSYVKFMKDILANKRKISDYEIVALSEEYSAILQRKCPPKIKDLESCTIPCSIGNSIFEKALCDLGASINLMPLSIFNKLGLGEVNPSTITLQLADRFLTHPQGIIEDVLVKVDKFIFSTDFIVLDMEEDKELPIILGRPFLATGRALIDVQKGELKLRVQDEEVTFNVLNTMKYPMCYSLSTQITQFIHTITHHTTIIKVHKECMI